MVVLGGWGVGCFKKITRDPVGLICRLRAVVRNNPPSTEPGLLSDHQQTRTGEH